MYNVVSLYRLKGEGRRRKELYIPLPTADVEMYTIHDRLLNTIFYLVDFTGCEAENCMDIFFSK